MLHELKCGLVIMMLTMAGIRCHLQHDIGACGTCVHRYTPALS